VYHFSPPGLNKRGLPWPLSCGTVIRAAWDANGMPQYKLGLEVRFCCVLAGCLLWELYTGTPLFPGNTALDMIHHINTIVDLQHLRSVLASGSNGGSQLQLPPGGTTPLQIDDMPDDFVEFIFHCLREVASERASASKLLELRFAHPLASLYHSCIALGVEPRTATLSSSSTRQHESGKINVGTAPSLASSNGAMGLVSCVLEVGGCAFRQKFWESVQVVRQATTKNSSYTSAYHCSYDDLMSASKPLNATVSVLCTKEPIWLWLVSLSRSSCPSICAVSGCQGFSRWP
jgi:hypothetical protein